MAVRGVALCGARLMCALKATGQVNNRARVAIPIDHRVAELWMPERLVVEQNPLTLE